NVLGDPPVTGKPPEMTLWVVTVAIFVMGSGLGRAPQTESTAALIDRLLAAPTAAERDAILDANSGAVTLELHRTLIARARSEERNFSKAVTDYETAVAVAERLHAAAETGVSYRGLGLAHYRQGHVE